MDSPCSNDILIYKIGDYANFTEVDSFINENNNSVIIEATLGSILGAVVLGSVGYIITFKRCKKNSSSSTDFETFSCDRLLLIKNH